MIFILNLLLLCVAAFFYLYQRTFYHWRSLGVKQFPFSPIKGNLGDVGVKSHIGELLTEYYTKTKALGLKFSGLYFNTNSILLLTDLDLIKRIMIKDFDNFSNHAPYVNEEDEPISAHLFNLNDERWKSMRSKVSPVFSGKKLKTMFVMISGVADKMISVIDKKVELTGQIDVKKIMCNFATDTIGNVAFGLECNSLHNEDSEFMKMAKTVFATGPSRYETFMMEKFPYLAKKLHIKCLTDEISNFYFAIVRKTVQNRIENPGEMRNDFMELMVDYYKRGELTIEQIVAQSFLLFIGYEGMSCLIACCLFELSVNPECQEKARQDVKDAIKRNGSLSYESLSDMHYLNKCINETLRKYPTGATAQRTCSRPYQIPDSNVTIPKGQSVLIPVYAIHWDSELYPKPEVFDPERFSPEKVAKRHHMAYLPFGAGQRHCIGMRLVFIIARMALVKILLNYEFELDKSKTSNPLKLAPSPIVVTPLENIFIKMKKNTEVD